jgi:hypothetical protein
VAHVRVTGIAACDAPLWARSCDRGWQIGPERRA